jgi:hypothetical protein
MAQCGSAYEAFWARRGAGGAGPAPAQARGGRGPGGAACGAALIYERLNSATVGLEAEERCRRGW